MRSATICSKCAQPVDSEAAACPHCGTSITIEAAAPTVNLGQEGAEEPSSAATVVVPRPAAAPEIDGYKIVRREGAGGMGEVYLAEDITLGRKVAIKMISREFAIDTDSRARFTREARAMAKVEHPHIVRIYSFGTVGENDYLVMEFVDGEELADKIHRLGKLDTRETLRYTRQIIEALKAAWESTIVHRDMKPTNVLIDRRDQVRVVDFGLAKPLALATDKTLTTDGHILGTPHYVSPEQAKGETVDFRSDIYSVGIMVYEMLTGHRPYAGATPYALVAKHLYDPLPPLRDVLPTIDAEVVRLVEWMTAKDPNSRPASYDELLAAIDRLVGERTPHPASPSMPRLVAEDVFPNHWLGWVITSLLILYPLAAIGLWSGLEPVAEMLAGFAPGMSHAPIPAAILFSILLILSGLLGYVVWRARVRSTSDGIRVGIPTAIAFIFAAIFVITASPSLWSRLAPRESNSGTLFTYGSYPDRDKLRSLRGDGYTAVISLLNPFLFPLETQLTLREQNAAKQAGIKLIQLPVVPWLGDAEASLVRVADLATKQSGRYYVHGYLSSDRLALVKQAVERATPPPQLKHTPPFTKFERGEIVSLEDAVYLTPFPTDDEIVRFAVAGGIKNVVTLLDPNDKDNLTLVGREKRQLEQYNIAFTALPITTNGVDFDPAQALGVARQVHGMAKPLMVHAFFPLSANKDAAAEAFAKAFRSQQPPLASVLFTEPLKNGPVQFVGANIAVGPRPEGREFGAYLYRRGIRQFVYVGDPMTKEAAEDRTIAAENGLAWKSIQPVQVDVAAVLGEGGPYYVYGPALPGVLPVLEKRFAIK